MYFGKLSVVVESIYLSIYLSIHSLYTSFILSFIDSYIIYLSLRKMGLHPTRTYEYEQIHVIYLLSIPSYFKKSVQTFISYFLDSDVTRSIGL